MHPFSPFSFLLRKPCSTLGQLYIELKTKSLLTKSSIVLPLHLVFNSSQDSNVDNICRISTRFQQGLFKSLGLYSIFLVNNKFRILGVSWQKKQVTWPFIYNFLGRWQRSTITNFDRKITTYFLVQSRGPTSRIYAPSWWFRRFWQGYRNACCSNR